MKKLTLKESQALQLNLMKEIHKVCEENKITYYLIAGSCLGAVRHGGFIPWDDDIDIGMFRKDYEKFCLIFDEKMNTDKYFLQNFKTDPNVHFALSRVCIKGTFYSNKRTDEKDICHNAYIDLFPLDNVPDNSFLSSLQSCLYYLVKLFIVAKTLKFDKIHSVIFFGLLKVGLCFVPLRGLHVLRICIMKFFENISTKEVCSLASKYSCKKQTMPIQYYQPPVRLSFEGNMFNVPAKTDKYLSHLYGEHFMELPPVEKRVKPHPIFIE